MQVELIKVADSAGSTVPREIQELPSYPLRYLQSLFLLVYSASMKSYQYRNYDISENI